MVWCNATHPSGVLEGVALPVQTSIGLPAGWKWCQSHAGALPSHTGTSDHTRALVPPHALQLVESGAHPLLQQRPAAQELTTPLLHHTTRVLLFNTSEVRERRPSSVHPHAHSQHPFHTSPHPVHTLFTPSSHHVHTMCTLCRCPVNTMSTPCSLSVHTMSTPCPHPQGCRWLPPPPPLQTHWCSTRSSG